MMHLLDKEHPNNAQQINNSNSGTYVTNTNNPKTSYNTKSILLLQNKHAKALAYSMLLFLSFVFPLGSILIYRKPKLKQDDPK